MVPIVYFGPPKTSTTFLYNALTRFSNHLQVGVKEWSYLHALNAVGEHSYVDRFNRLFGTAIAKATWLPIYKSYIEHLSHFIIHPSS